MHVHTCSHVGHDIILFQHYFGNTKIFSVSESAQLSSRILFVISLSLFMYIVRVQVEQQYSKMMEICFLSTKKNNVKLDNRWWFPTFSFSYNFMLLKMMCIVSLNIFIIVKSDKSAKISDMLSCFLLASSVNTWDILISISHIFLSCMSSSFKMPFEFWHHHDI